MLDPVLIAKIASLELRARRIVEGAVVGRDASPYHGFSIEFAEHRDYAPGDDLRYLDWKLHAKTDRFHLKQFEEETNLNAYLLLDTSESMDFGSEAAPWTKLECAKTLAAAIAFLVVQQRDAIGLATFNDRVGELLQPSRKQGSLPRIYKNLEEIRPTGETRLGSALHEFAGRLGRRGLVIVISDLFDDVAELSRGIQRLVHHQHDVRVAQVVDPMEVDFSYDEAIRFEGLESAPDVTIDAGALRQAYRKEFQEHQKAISRSCRGAGVSHQLISTADPPDLALRRLLGSNRTAS